jgi:hypothetical protein
MSDRRITRDDLESSLKGLQNSVIGEVEQRKQQLLGVIAVGGVVLLVVFFLLGRRSGKRRTTMVEIRRL